ncbi:MAG: hypothetical protein CMJ31_11675 [Phycisphaerae bacterium]|nr:hypothetical protein [Phycisphaerae bacterium]|tara:strand:- start:417 stop:689 length:273 start_codon:yes stop_codon:yes gene_type:complete
MQPATGDWELVRFTLGFWLLPREDRANWIKVLQPVSFEPNDDWCDHLETAIEWLDNKVQKTISARRHERSAFQLAPSIRGISSRGTSDKL